jgi:hypothetical protein
MNFQEMRCVFIVIDAGHFTLWGALSAIGARLPGKMAATLHRGGKLISAVIFSDQQFEIVSQSRKIASDQFQDHCFSGASLR